MRQADKPVVEFVRPRCPVCRKPRLRTIHSDTQPDGSVLRDSKCRNCGAKVLVIAR